MKVFLAIWEVRSISVAGERLGLTQPAVSHSLRRLRERFDDPLFLRSGHRMLPTDVAERLYEPFNRAIQIISHTVLDSNEFRPAESDRTFTIAMSDISEFYCLPLMLSYLEKAAPAVRIKSIQLEAHTVGAALRSGQVDLALGYLPDLVKPDYISTFVLEDWFICLVRASHPMAGKLLTQEAFSQLTFVEVAVHATGYKMVDALLTQLGVRRSTAVRLEHFTNVPEIVRYSQFAAIFPHSASQKINATGAFALLNIPFDLPSIDVQLHIHSNFRNDAGLRWMQQAITWIFSTMEKKEKAAGV
ncbi:LysR family transcriptional regulator [Phyllobacterium sp. YR531]|uniref:LysR family transcriptional regulator n=1 Tax=Phyllobacterium sp. YR531 TaxID=1144343 RepID=UPI00138ACAB6|nr:LysR family transcriptional regulator [Phyllobacterium sp. YR531]